MITIRIALLNEFLRTIFTSIIPVIEYRALRCMLDRDWLIQRYLWVAKRENSLSVGGPILGRRGSNWRFLDEVSSLLFTGSSAIVKIYRADYARVCGRRSFRPFPRGGVS